MKRIFITKSYKLLLLISLLVFGIYVLFAFTSLGYHHADEYFQIIEFGRYRMGLEPGLTLPWEYYARLRPVLQPVIFMGIFKGCLYAGITNPYSQILVVRLISSVLSFLSLLLLFNYALKILKNPGNGKYYFCFSRFYSCGICRTWEPASQVKTGPVLFLYTAFY